MRVFCCEWIGGFVFTGEIMEELLVYALLLYEGFDIEEEYQKCLDELFVDNPTDDDLLELEFMCSDIKKTIIYIRTHVDYNNFNHNIFGRILMQKLKVYYESMQLRKFADRMFLLWEGLPGNIQCKEPFHALSYADDPLSWGDEEQTRELYEAMLNYYDNI